MGWSAKMRMQVNLNYFKQGAYNQTNGKDPASNMVWCAGAEIYNGDLKKQYANGSYTEVWFKETTIDADSAPEKGKNNR